MRVVIKRNSVMHIIPETDTEDFALRAWTENAVEMGIRDKKGLEKHFFKGSLLELEKFGGNQKTS